MNDTDIDTDALTPAVTPPFDPMVQRLFKARIVIISGEITQDVAQKVMAQLLALAAVSATEPITVYINSQGGHVEAGDSIHDMIRYISPPVRIVGTGWVASIATLIFVSVPRSHRYCLPNTRFLLHQPAGGMRGSAADVEIEAREILRMRQRLNQIFAENTGQTVARIEEDTRRNFWLSAEAALDYGLVGRIVKSREDVF